MIDHLKDAAVFVLVGVWLLMAAGVIFAIMLVMWLCQYGCQQ